MKRLLTLSLLVCSAALAQNAALMPNPRITFLDASGAPLVGGYLRTCVAGTACSALHAWSTPSNPLATYTDSTAGTPAANPILLDGAGSASVWLGSGTYKLVLTDANGVQIWSQDNVVSLQSLKTNGVSFITYTASGSSTVRTIAAKLGETVSVKDFGALGDGVTDDKAAIQTALNSGAGTVLFPPGTYIISPPAGGATANAALSIPSNVTVNLTAQTTIKAMTGYVEGQRLIDIMQADNVTVNGNGGTVQMVKSEYTSGEQRHAIYVSQSSNVRLLNLYVRDTGGEGILIAGQLGHGGTPSRNVLVQGCHVDNARRNGIGITDAINVQVKDSEITNTNGTSPQAGIDIEPNELETIQNVLIEGVRTANNAMKGISVVPNFLSEARGSIYSLTIRNYVSYQDGTSQGAVGMRFVVSPTDTITYKVAGKILVENVLIVNPYTAGVNVIRWHNMLPDLLFRNVVVTDPNRGAQTLFDMDSGWTTGEQTNAANSGFVIGTAPSSPSTITGHVEFYNCMAQDTRATATMLLGFYLHAGGSGSLGIDAYLKDPKTINQTSTSNSAVNWNLGQGTVEYSVRPVYAPTGSTLISNWMGYEITPTTAAVITLPAANVVNGATYFFRTNGTGFTVAPATGDTVDLYGLAASATFTVAQTGRGIRTIGLMANGATNWRVISQGSFFESNGPLYAVGGYGSASPVGPTNLALGASGTAPDAVSAAFGDGSGVKFNFGYHNGTSFVPGAYISDVGRVNGTSFSVGGTVGLTVVKNLTGSGGAACTETFTSGILTASTCP